MSCALNNQDLDLKGPKAKHPEAKASEVSIVKEE